MLDSRSSRDDEQLTVLIVEDKTALANLYGRWIDDDYDVEITYTGEAALERLTDAIDVVFLDRRMPGLSGDAVLETIRERDLDCRVVIVSAVKPDFDVIGMGFDDYLTKPLDRVDLHDAVERMQRRMRYTRAVQKFHQLAATRAALQTEKSENELRSSDKYAVLEEQLESAKERADTALADLDEERLATVIRTLDTKLGSTDAAMKEK